MKRAFIIVAVVTGYSLLETSALLGLLLPNNRSAGPSPFQSVVLFGQLLLIPGMAAILSRIMYGSSGWRRRALAIFAVGSLGLPASIALFAVVMAIVDSALVWSTWGSFIALLLFITSHRRRFVLRIQNGRQAERSARGVEMAD